VVWAVAAVVSAAGVRAARRAIEGTLKIIVVSV
jgi:hypothetical protein